MGKDSRLQFDGHFIGPKSLTQGKEHGYAYFNLAFRQQFLKGKLAFAAVANDVFHTAKYYNRRTSAGLSSETWVRPKYPNIVFSLSYIFNAGGKHSSSTGSGSLFEGRDF